jgi:poly-gamma-glutamate capsule biosynthesis protein CapA/YwtB (metallophosphatase superfamily)
VEVAAVLVPGGQERRGIPADGERQFAAGMGATTVEVDCGHLATISQPAEVVKLVQAAVGGVAAAG